MAKEEKLRSRREAREERQRLADKNVQEMAAMLRGKEKTKSKYKQLIDGFYL